MLELVSVLASPPPAVAHRLAVDEESLVIHHLRDVLRAMRMLAYGAVAFARHLMALAVDASAATDKRNSNLPAASCVSVGGCADESARGGDPPVWARK